MALRQLLKVDGFFLVKYHEDDKFQVRRRGQIQTEEEVSLRIFCYVTLKNINLKKKNIYIQSAAKSPTRLYVCSLARYFPFHIFDQGII